MLTKYPVSNVATTGVKSTAQQLFGTACGTASTDNIPCALSVIDVGTFNAQNFTHAKQYSGRIDKYFSKDRIYATLFRDTSLGGTAALRSDFTTTTPLYNIAEQVNETHEFSAKTLNEAGFSATRIEGINNSTGNFTVPILNISGLGTGFGTGSPLQDYVQYGYHWRDVVSHVLRNQQPQGWLRRHSHPAGEPIRAGRTTAGLYLHEPDQLHQRQPIF